MVLGIFGAAVIACGPAAGEEGGDCVDKGGILTGPFYTCNVGLVCDQDRICRWDTAPSSEGPPSTRPAGSNCNPATMGSEHCDGGSCASHSDDGGTDAAAVDASDDGGNAPD